MLFLLLLLAAGIGTLLYWAFPISIFFAMGIISVGLPAFIWSVLCVMDIFIDYTTKRR